MEKLFEMYSAVKRNNLRKLLPLLRYYDQNEVNEHGDLCLLRAAIQSNFINFIPHLLAAGAAFNPRYTDSGVLNLALELHCQEALLMFDEFAHEQLADALTFRTNGLTPFLSAAAHRNVEAMRLLTRVRPNSVARARARQLNIRLPPLTAANREILDAVSTWNPRANALTLAVQGRNNHLYTIETSTRMLYDTVKFLFDRGVVPLDATPLLEFFRLKLSHQTFVQYQLDKTERETIYTLALMLSHGLTLPERQRALLDMLAALDNKYNKILLFKEFVRALHDNDPQGPLFQENIAALFQAFQALTNHFAIEAMTEVLLFIFRKAELRAADINPLLPEIFALEDTKLLHCILKRFLVHPALIFYDMQEVHGRNLPRQVRHMFLSSHGRLNITPEMRASPTPAGDLLREALNFPKVQYYLGGV